MYALAYASGGGDDGGESYCGITPQITTLFERNAFTVKTFICGRKGQRETVMSKVETRLKLVDEDKIPVAVSKKAEEWVKMLKQIPRGKAWVTTDKELGIQAGSMHSIVYKYVKMGLLPNTYRVVRRTKGDTTIIYIINTAKTDEVLDLKGEKK